MWRPSSTLNSRTIPFLNRSTLYGLLVVVAVSSALCYSHHWLDVYSPGSRIGLVVRFLADKGKDRPLVLFMGSSRFMSGINAGELARSEYFRPYRVLNIAREDMGVWQAFAVLRNAEHLSGKVRCVVLEIGPSMFNSNPLDPITKQMVRYPGEFDLWADYGERLLVERRGDRWELLAKYYLPCLSEKRSLTSWLFLLKTMLTGRSPKAEMYPMPYFSDRRKELLLASDPDFRAENIGRYHLYRYAFSEPEKKVLENFLSYLKARHIEVILVHPPARAGYYKYVLSDPRWHSGYKKFLDFMESLGRDHKMIFWLTPSDCGLKDSIFVDYGHFTYPGSIEFSRRLAEEIKIKYPAASSQPFG